MRIEKSVLLHTLLLFFFNQYCIIFCIADRYSAMHEIKATGNRPLFDGGQGRSVCDR